jgi:major membrane immunogen (membrane-anchored lipoprotein)
MKVSYKLIILAICILSPSFCIGQDLVTGAKLSQDTTRRFKDGIYEGKSQSEYAAEPFWGIVRIKVENGLFAGIDFLIRDSALHETFNEKYEIHFKDIPEYVEQCRNDWKGVQTYPLILNQAQDVDKVDAMSGATWSYNIFKASAKDALKDAGK